MNYERVKNLVLGIHRFEVVWLKLGLISPMRCPKGISSVIFQIGPSLRRVIPSLVRTIGILKEGKLSLRKSMSMLLPKLLLK